jgi:subfamily B ATP-binding cassette protein MsbA
MLVSRVAGLVPAASSKYLIDTVLKAPGRPDLLLPLAGAVLLATLVQGVTSFALSQVISVTAQRAITDMRRRVMQHISRLPIRYFDSTQVGVLVSRVMNDAEGIRNLVGTGIVQLVGSLFTASLALVALLYLNWVLTIAIVVILGAFGFTMTTTFKNLRPIFRELGAVGYLPYRLGLHGMDALPAAADDHGALMQRLKAALDPNDILSPGRYDFRGDWPRPR